MVKNEKPIRVAVTGITGRMGKEIVRRIVQLQNVPNPSIILGAALVRSKSEICRKDIGTVIQSNFIGVSISDSIACVKDNFDILIDFTAPIATVEYLEFCALNNKNMVIGTTGLDEYHWNLMNQFSKSIGIVYSANFSIGITLMLKLLQNSIRVIGNYVDIDIIETHHNKKKDVPSGTSIMLRKVIEASKINNSFISWNELESSCNSARDICIHSIRSGNFVGEHTVLFTGEEERLEITHKAFSRSIFVNGVLRSVCWLGCFKKGLFDLSHVLQLKL